MVGKEVIILRIFQVDKNIEALIIGIKDVNIKDPEVLLKNIQKVVIGGFAQGFVAQFIAGPKHLELIIKQAWEAKKRNIPYVEKFDLDLLIRIACTLQIHKALKTVGFKKGIMDIVILAIGKEKTLKNLIKYVNSIGTFSDQVLEGNTERIEFLKSTYKISKELIENTLYRKDILAYLLTEKAAILKAKS